jgi:phosphoribosylanthranilate isomerase
MVSSDENTNKKKEREMNTDKMLVKVCGMRDADNIREVSQLGVDMIGFIFYPKSPRFVQMISSKAGIIPDYSEERIELAMARKTAETQKQPARVGVFVDDMPQNIVTLVHMTQSRLWKEKDYC